MRLFLICCVMFLTACSQEVRVETRFVVPEVGQELRQPCIPPDRDYESVADAALIFTDHVECLNTANARIVATDKNVRITITIYVRNMGGVGAW